MKRVRSTEMPVGYVMIKTEEYADLIANAAVGDLMKELKSEKKKSSEYLDRAWKAEGELEKLKNRLKKEGGNPDGA